MAFAVLTICCLAAAILITGLARTYALRRNMLDLPNARSSHRVPTPRGGGIGIVIPFLAGIGALYALGTLDMAAALAFAGGVPLAVVGWLDDSRGLRASVRAVVHLACGAWAVALLARDFAPFAAPALNAMCLAGLAVGVMWLINLYNFMDGIDGIAAGEAVTAAGIGGAMLLAAGSGVPGRPAVLLAACCAGFLWWNRPPARIFMGDVASGFLGYAFGVLGLISMRGFAASGWFWAILLGVFLVDATLTLTVRIARGLRWYEAHRTHAFQHEAARLSSHSAVTGRVLAVNIIWLAPWAWAHQRGLILGPIAAAFALAPLTAAAWQLGAGRDAPAESPARTPRLPLGTLAGTRDAPAESPARTPVGETNLEIAAEKSACEEVHA